MKVVIDNKIPFIKDVLEPFADINYLIDSEINAESVKDADALIIRTRTICNSRLLDNTNVKFIASATIGFDHIDTEYCKKKGIVWTNSQGCNSGAVQQYIASALLEISHQKEIDLRNRTLGVIGVGNIGKKVVRLAESLGMRVVINDPPRARSEGDCGFLSLKGLLKEADIITFHTPLNMDGEDKTFHLVNEQFIAIVINYDVSHNLLNYLKP